MKTVRDNVAVFGQFGGLIGIVSERMDAGRGTADAAGHEVPAVLIVNTGTIHRVGAGRLSTLWARRLAERGHCVLRFDLSGIGDSKRREDILAPVDAALADVRDAIDWLQAARRTRRVILIGLCTGADLSLVYAGTDPRVCGMVIIDSSTPPTARHYMGKLLTRKVWKRQLQRVVRRIKSRADPSLPAIAADAAQVDHMALNQTPLREIVSKAYRTAFTNEVRALAIFTTGASWYNYRRQLFDAFPEIQFAGNLQLEYFKRCDHMITHESNRVRLFAVVDCWLEKTSFKAPATPVEPVVPAPSGSASDSGGLVSMEF